MPCPKKVAGCHKIIAVSLKEQWTYGESETGTHVGVVKILSTEQTVTTFYLNVSTILNPTQMVVLATGYNTSCEW